MNKKCSPQDLLYMTEQLAVLINASLPLVFCLKLLAKQFKPMIRRVFHQMIIAIEQGESLSGALQYHSLFPSYFIRLIQVGEESGQLGLVLSQLTAYQEKILLRTMLLKKALIYPVFVLCISLFITLALMLWIVPQFQLLFTEMTTSLPAMTLFVFKLSDLLQRIHPIYYLLFSLGLWGIFYGIKQYPKAVLFEQEIVYHLPFIGQIIHIHQQIRYLRSLGLAVQAGLPLIKALHLAGQVVQKTRLQRKIILIPKQIESGIKLRQALTQTTQFDEIVIQLVTIGEQTSQLPILLIHSAHILEQRIEKRIQHFTSLLQPILVVLLGLILGCLIIALYLPIFKLGTLY